ncbi:MAG: hypothetical protein ACI9FJ_000616 [Alteromonadaceae bacterium]|jgi:hypothetical protein
MKHSSIKQIIGLVVLPLVLTACANHDKPDRKMQETFVTNISEDGSKRFNYAMTVIGGKSTGKKSEQKEAQKSGQKGSRGAGRGDTGRGDTGRGGKGAGGRGNSGSRNGAGQGSSRPDVQKVQQKLKLKMTENLELRLQQSGYCREGYLELNSYFGRGQSQIRGECKEGATEDDRSQFVNPKINLSGHSMN